MSYYKRKPLRLDRYIRIHEQNMQHLERAGFVLEDSLRLMIRRHEVILCGHIFCPGRIVLSVNKKMAVVAWERKIPIVKTKTYEYNASLEGLHNLLRYDNTHRGERYSGHFDDFHKHLFDLETGVQLAGSPRWVGELMWPTLDKVIEEVCFLYNENKELIDSVVQSKSLDLDFIA